MASLKKIDEYSEALKESRFTPLVKDQPILKRPSKGKYISIEGISGSGKSYTIDHLREYFDFVTIKEITESNDKVTNSIFKLLESDSDNFFFKFPPISGAMLIYSAQTYMLEKEITSVLEDNKIVVVDRAVDSPAIYQSIINNWKNYEPNKVQESYNQILETMKNILYFPDKTFVLDEDFSLCISRAEGRNNKKYSSLELKILQRAHEGYKLIRDDNRITKITKAKEIIPTIQRFVKGEN